METGDLAQLIGCAFLRLSQQPERVARAELTLVILAPSLNETFREDLLTLGWSADQREPGLIEEELDRLHELLERKRTP